VVNLKRFGMAHQVGPLGYRWVIRHIELDQATRILQALDQGRVGSQEVDSVCQLGQWPPDQVDLLNLLCTGGQVESAFPNAGRVMAQQALQAAQSLTEKSVRPQLGGRLVQGQYLTLPTQGCIHETAQARSSQALASPAAPDLVDSAATPAHSRQATAAGRVDRSILSDPRATRIACCAVAAAKKKPPEGGRAGGALKRSMASHGALAADAAAAGAAGSSNLAPPLLAM
jgi:hypothetical protein